MKKMKSFEARSLSVTCSRSLVRLFSSFGQNPLFSLMISSSSSIIFSGLWVRIYFTSVVFPTSGEPMMMADVCCMLFVLFFVFPVG